MSPSLGRAGAVVTVAAIICGNAAPPMIYDALAPVLPAIARHFGGGTAGEAIAQAAIAVATLGMGLAGLFTAALASRFGFRRAMAGGWILFGIFGTVGVVSLPAPLLLASRFLLGLSGGLLMAIAGIAVAARYSGDEAARARMMGINLAVGPFSAIAFLIAAAALADISWRAPFLLHAGLAVAGLMLVCAARLPSAPHPDQRAKRPGLNGLRPAVPAYLAIFAGLVVSNLFNVQIAFLLASRGAGEPATVASVMSAMLLALATTYTVFGPVYRRLGTMGTILLGMIFFIAASLLCASFESLSVTAAGMACAGVAMGLTVAAAMNLIMDRCSAEVTPAALGAATTLIYASGAVAPAIFVPLRSITGYEGLYYLCALAMGLSVSALILVRARRGRRSLGLTGTADEG